MKKMSEDKTSVTFSCEGKCSEYNMASTAWMARNSRILSHFCYRVFIR